MSKFNLNYDDGQFEKIFGESEKKQGKHTYIFDEDKGKLVPLEEYYRDNPPQSSGPHLFFKGKGWGYQHKKFRGVSMSRKQFKKMKETNGLFTTIKDKRKKIKEKTEKAKERKAQEIKKIKGNSL